MPMSMQAEMRDQDAAMTARRDGSAGRTAHQPVFDALPVQLPLAAVAETDKSLMLPGAAAAAPRASAEVIPANIPSNFASSIQQKSELLAGERVLRQAPSFGGKRVSVSDRLASVRSMMMSPSSMEPPVPEQ